MLRAANLLNERPISTLPDVDSYLNVLTPNALLLGRACAKNPGNWQPDRHIESLSSGTSSCERILKQMDRVVCANIDDQLQMDHTKSWRETWRCRPDSRQDFAKRRLPSWNGPGSSFE